MEPNAPLDLRPLTIGEIFDRAITLYARNFVVFTLMILTIVLPLGVIQYVILPNQAKLLQEDIQIFQHLPTPGHPQTHAPKVPPVLSESQWFGLGAVLLLGLALIPIATNTVALGVASLYGGQRPELARCFQTVLRRWPRLIGVILLEAVAVGVVYIFGAFMIGILAAVGILLVKTFIAAAVVSFIAVFVALIGLVLLLMMLLIAASFALFGVTMENLGIAAAFASGMTRIFNRRQIKASALMTLAYFALNIGVGIISVTAAALFLLVLHNVFIQGAFAIIVNAILSAFLTVLLAVFYYDVRIRHEGFDLEADLQRIVTT